MFFDTLQTKMESFGVSAKFFLVLKVQKTHNLP